jgi:ureidoglycolate hydrolase
MRNSGSEKKVPALLLEIGESFEQKYTPVLDFDGWRVAMLRHSEATDRTAFQRIERHNETNEIFILTEGKAYLIIGEEDDRRPEIFHVFPMRLNVAYNIKPHVWHHAILSEDAHIILFEKTNTDKSNSDYYFPDEKVKAGLRKKIDL